MVSRIHFTLGSAFDNYTVDRAGLGYKLMIVKRVELLHNITE